MKQKSLHLQILSYLKKQKEIVNLEKVFEEFLGDGKGLLIDETVSECRGDGCFQRMSAILFAIKHLQDDGQIALAHIDAVVAKDYSIYFSNSRKIGRNVDTLTQEWKVTGYYQDFLIEHILSPIFVSDEADEYIKRDGVSRELRQAKIQTCFAIAAVVVAVLTLATTILLHNCC